MGVVGSGVGVRNRIFSGKLAELHLGSPVFAAVLRGGGGDVVSGTSGSAGVDVIDAILLSG